MLLAVVGASMIAWALATGTGDLSAKCHADSFIVMS